MPALKEHDNKDEDKNEFDEHNEQHLIGVMKHQVPPLELRLDDIFRGLGDVKDEAARWPSSAKACLVRSTPIQHRKKRQSW